MKNPFADFLEEIRMAGCDEPLGEAYRMDGRGASGMRARAGLGDALACCDYLRVERKGFILIEDTELGRTVSEMRREYGSLEGDEALRREFVRERVRRENCLKVYGAFLVLCRMKQWPARCVFWLVISGGEGNARVIRNWDPDGELETDIMSALAGGAKSRPFEGGLPGTNLVAKVKVMTADELRKLLEKREPMSVGSQISDQ